MRAHGKKLHLAFILLILRKTAIEMVFLALHSLYVVASTN